MVVTNESVQVTSVPSRIEADLVIGLLQSENIESWAIGDDAGGEIGCLAQDGVRVYVRAADAARAQEILADLPS